MTEIITGIRVDVSGVELRQHCENRSLYHKNRADLYQAETKKIEELRRSGDEAANKQISKGSTNIDPLESLERSMKEHRAKERFFKFTSEHFVAGATYRIDLNDLNAYELAPGIRNY